MSGCRELRQGRAEETKQLVRGGARGVDRFPVLVVELQRDGQERSKLVSRLLFDLEVVLKVGADYEFYRNWRFFPVLRWACCGHVEWVF